MGDPIGRQLVQHRDHLAVGGLLVAAQMHHAGGVVAHLELHQLHQIGGVDLFGAERQFAVLADNHDDRLLGIERMRRLGLRQLHFHAGGEQRRRDHEDDQQHQHDVHQRRHVDVGLRTVKSRPIGEVLR